MSAKLNKTLLKGSLTLLIAFNIFNLLNLLFQFSMARMLSISDYGILATLFSLIYIMAIFSDSIQTIITKYSSRENNPGKLKDILKKTVKKALKIASVLFLAYAGVLFFLAPLLKISYFLLLVNGSMIFASFMIPITRGIIQGKKKFGALGMNMIIDGATKLIFAVILVYIGWKVYGAIAATFLGMVMAFIFSFTPLREITNAKEKSSQTKGIYQYAPSVFVLLLAISLFYSIDVIIAKIVFDAETAGFYALASVIAKTIFIGTQPISRALFSFASEKKKPEKSLFTNALVILSVCIVAALAVFYFFPHVLVRLFAGRYLEASISIIFYLAIGVSFISLSNLILFHKLSMNKTKNFMLFLIFPVIEALLLLIFSHNLLEFSIAFILSATIFLWGSVLLLNE